MATLEAGTTLKAATNRNRHTEKFIGDTYPWEYLPENYLHVWNYQPHGREGGEGARIRNDSQEDTIDPLRSASKATMQYNTSHMKPE